MLALIAALEIESLPIRRQLSAAECLPGEFQLYRGQIAAREVVLIHSGIGKASAAAATAALLTHLRPEALINFGCGGAYPGCQLKPGDLALANAEIYADEGSNSPTGFLDLEQLDLPLCRRGNQRFYNRLPIATELLKQVEPSLLSQVRREHFRFATGPFVTVSTCTGTDHQGEQRAHASGGICENMEGAAIAQTAFRFAVPFLELRGISNLAADRDRADWDMPAAFRSAQWGLQTMLEHWPETS